MSHRRNNTTVSTASEPSPSSSISTSHSSEASIQFYQERIEPNINKLSKSDLRNLFGEAEKIIKETLTPNPRSIYALKKDSEEICVKLDSVMLALLYYAKECGGESAQCYVTSAILACSKEEEVVGALEALGTTWLIHFLFILKISSLRDHRNHVLEEKRSPFCENVLRRDGYTCVVTGYQDFWHPKPDRSKGPKVRLHAAHILSWPMSRNVSSCDDVSLASFEILLNYTGLPVMTVEGLYADLNDPSNGIALQFDAEYGFDNYKWSLNKTLEEHVYSVKTFGNSNLSGIIRLPSKMISFKDHSDDLPPPGKRKCSIPLPIPRYIEIHAAIAGILHTSGAGNFFDKLLNGFEDDDGRIPAVGSWSEFESLMKETT